MTTFNKLLAIKDGGGNPGAPGSADSLDLTLSGFASAVSTFDLTASANSLVAFDAASLDFGNAAANPAFNFLGAGDFAVDGDSWFKAVGGNSGDPDFLVDGYAKFAGVVELADDLSVGGNLSVSGTSGLTGNVTMAADASVGANLSVTGTSTLTGDVSMSANLLVSGNGTVNGNLTVKGTLVTKNTESVLISDNYIDMNSDYTAVSPQDAGFTFNYSPIENADIASFAANSITLSAAFAASVVAGDFILVAGLDAGLEANEGIYEVSTVAGATILINTAPSLSFVKASISAAAAPGATAKAALINLAVIRTSSAGKLEWATGANSSLTFGEVPFDGYVGFQAWGGSFSVQETAGYPAPFSVKSVIGSDFLSVDPSTNAAILYGDLVINNSAATQSNGLGLQTAAGDPGIGAGVGSVYVKEIASIDELFYISMISGTPTPVQITKDGALNIDVLTFPLQEAYNDGNTIDISTNNRPLSINIGAFSGDALSVIGPTNLDGALDVTGIADFSAAGGGIGTEKFKVAGVALFSDAVYMASSLSVSSTLGAGASTLDSLTVTNNASVGGTFGATGAATLSDTLAVTGAATLSSTLGVTGAATLSSSLDVTGAVLLLSTLNVTDAATLNGAVTVDNTLLVSQGATLSSTLDVTGASTLGALDAGSTTLDDLAVSGGSSFSTVAASGAVILNDTLSVALGATLSSTLDVTGAATFLNTVTSNGTLTAENELVVNGNYIRIAEAAGWAAPAADSGDVYVSEDPAAAGHAELWYYGDGTANAVMITKNGQLNIDVLTFSLQAAYDDGSAIVTNAINGAVSITAGAGLTDALDVTGNVDIVGALDASGKVHLTSTGGGPTVSSQIPDLRVDGYSQFAEVWATGALGVGGAATLNSTLDVLGAATFSSTLTGYGNLALQDGSYADKFTVAAASGNVWAAGTLDVDGAVAFSSTLDVTGAATLSSTLAVTGNITASADVSVAGILDLNGSVDADVTAFDVLSSGDVSIKASGILSLKGPAVAANMNEQAASAIASGDLVMMTAFGLAKAQANAKNVIALGAALSAIAANASSEGLVAEFGSVMVNADVAIAKGDRLYLSAATAGAVTNAEPTATDSSVFQVGVALAASASGQVKVALRPQFMYNVY